MNYLFIKNMRCRNLFNNRYLFCYIKYRSRHNNDSWLVANIYFFTKNIKLGMNLKPIQLYISFIQSRKWSLTYIKDSQFHYLFFCQKYKARYVLETLSIASTYFLILNIKCKMYLESVFIYQVKIWSVKV